MNLDNEVEKLFGMQESDINDSWTRAIRKKLGFPSTKVVMHTYIHIDAHTNELNGNVSKLNTHLFKSSI